MSLCIIVLGQERTFWKGGSDQLMNVVTTSKTHYSRIHMILVLSGTFQKDKLNTFLSETGVTSQCIDYTTDMCDAHVLRSTEYADCKARYLSSVPSDACREISDPDTYVKQAVYQFHQLQIAIDAVSAAGSFDVIMKTRFDVWYHPGFYPRVPPEDARPEDRILINETIKNVYRSRGIDVTSSDYMELLRRNPVILPHCRVHPELYHYSLGGSYLSNHIALNDLLNGSTSVVYCFNDHVLFGRSCDIMQLRGLIDEYACKPSPVNITHFYAQEAQLIIFCLNHGLNPIMYLHDTIHTILR
jgi:hypothetical protein